VTSPVKGDGVSLAPARGMRHEQAGGGQHVVAGRISLDRFVSLAQPGSGQ
jgi:hypothetical protein